MPPAPPAPGSRTRFLWAIASYVAVQSLVMGVSVLPAALVLVAVAPHLPSATWARLALAAVGLLPIYFVFALTFMGATVAATRLLGWRPRPGLVMRIADFGWPLLDWARGGMCTHAVRLLVGTPFRGTPLWGLFLRLNGARVGKGVWINSISIIDHELLTFGDGCVVGHDVHLSGHTVEDGCVKTGTVHVGRHATIGVGSVIGIDVEIGDGCKVGALSFVPKHTRLEAGKTYGGIPVHELPHASASPTA
ncbi:MAG TPA: hypothetical protein VFV33_02300 [Gemmatimonadaceae bacterium]|nr:hypothetical protein [Gemmatimonadaceae bacterium]